MEVLMETVTNIEWKNFKDINLNDPFFDSLKQDYQGFETWFYKKASEENWKPTFFLRYLKVKL